MTSIKCMKGNEREYSEFSRVTMRERKQRGREFFLGRSGAIKTPEPFYPRQKTRTPHLMRISLIIVRTLLHRNSIHMFLVTQERT
jgi:hypothetical protein